MNVPRNTWSLVLTGALLVALIAGPVVVIATGGLRIHVDSSAAADWAQMLQGVATVGAVIVALRGITIERRRARSDRAAAVDAQATGVFVWLAPHGGEGGRRRWYLHFENRTGVPVYEWLVEMSDLPGHLCSDRLGPLRPNESELLVDDLTGLPHTAVPRPVLYFADVFARTWKRDERGATSRQDPLPQCQHGSVADRQPERMAGWMT